MTGSSAQDLYDLLVMADVAGRIADVVFRFIKALSHSDV